MGGLGPRLRAVTLRCPNATRCPTGYTVNSPSCKLVERGTSWSPCVCVCVCVHRLYDSPRCHVFYGIVPYRQLPADSVARARKIATTDSLDDTRYNIERTFLSPSFALLCLVNARSSSRKEPFNERLNAAP